MLPGFFLLPCWIRLREQHNLVFIFNYYLNKMTRKSSRDYLTIPEYSLAFSPSVLFWGGEDRTYYVQPNESNLVFRHIAQPCSQVPLLLHFGGSRPLLPFCPKGSSGSNRCLSLSICLLHSDLPSRDRVFSLQMLVLSPHPTDLISCKLVPKRSGSYCAF